ncbi:hypothetical protein Tco_1288044, partial [Tanacetum coccineum]
MSNDPYFFILIPETISEESTSSDVISTIVHSDAPISEHLSKWTKDHQLQNIIGDPSRPVSTRLQLHEQALFCYYNAFLTLVEPKTYKDALTQSCWIEEMQEECWEIYIPNLVPLVIYLVPLVIVSTDSTKYYILPPPPSPSQTPTQQTPHTVSTIKLPILKNGEYDIWAMKMEHYLAHTDYPIWEVLQNGNGPVSIITDTQGQIKVLPPRTVEEILASERERKARTTLLMALPEDHLAKFHTMTDVKEMWESIRSRFRGNDELKKMQKYILKQQFEGFSVSNSEGLHKG